ncbi:MAG: membrane protein insertion efficiency factor YidD [Campylobacteraceae bacterium]|nr:membrane protein insertion efficiency factor YidD [Campylobacteraceae bacterium]
MKSSTSKIIKFYQKYLSIFSHGSCRYYPTCSEYCLWQLENNTFFKAIYFTIARVLKCNQLFRGGIDYPIVKCKNTNIIFKKIVVIYWQIPKKNNTCYIIKNREWKNKNEQSK